MLKRLQTYLEYGNRFCGIEQTALYGEDIHYVTVLKKSKKQLNIQSTFHVTSLDALHTKLEKKQHVFLIINNDQVLTKRIESTQTEIQKLVYTAFPNINLEDFLCEIYTQEHSQFVSICRKTYVEKLISQYKNIGISIINIALGNSAIASISGFIGSETFFTSNASLLIKNKTIEQIKKLDHIAPIDYNINGLLVNNTQVLSLSGALDPLLHGFQPITNFDDLKGTLKKEHVQSRTFSLFLKTGLTAILSVLLINFFVFNYYFNKVNTLKQTSQINQTTKQNLLKLNKEVSKSQKMVEDMLKGSSSKSSFYANTIIQSLPQSVLLTAFNYQPILKRIKKEQHITINTNTILISGASNNSAQFSIWLADLETVKWIQQVDILNYEDTSKSKSNFGIKLTIVDEK